VLVSGLDRALDAGYAALAALAPGADPRVAIEALARDAAPAMAAALPPWAAQALADAHGVARALSADLDNSQQSNAALALQVAEARSAHAARDENERALRERIDALAATRSDLAELKTAMQGEIDAARGNIEALVGEIDAARSAHAARDEREAQLAAELEALAAAADGLRAECATLRGERDTAASRSAALDAELQGARAALASRERENADLAETNGRAQEALRSLSGELERRSVAEKLLIADRDRLVVLERAARDRIATVEGELTEARGLAHLLGERLATASGELERLEARWLGRLARRFARP
jgi:chromosome segregation ATPase